MGRDGRSILNLSVSSLFLLHAMSPRTHTHIHTHTHTHTTHTHTQKVTLVHGRGTGTHTKNGARLGGQQVEKRRRGKAFTRARERRCLGPAMLWHPHLARSSSHTHPCKQRNVKKKKQGGKREKKRDSPRQPRHLHSHAPGGGARAGGRVRGVGEGGGRTSLRGSQPRRPPTPRPPARSRPENTHTHTHTSR